MATSVFVAGATGVMGRVLVPLLREAGHAVTGMTRNAEGLAWLAAQGVDGVAADVFDAAALERAMAAAAPEILIDQLTDLSGGIDPDAPEEGTRRNARIRREGTANLVSAARSAPVRRMIVQSIGWAYAPKATPFVETDPLDLRASGTRAITVGEGIVPLENAVLRQSDFEGIVLRYGQLYGPGTWSATPSGASPVHVEAAAYAALLAIDYGKSGAYNVAEPGGALDVSKAMTDLRWRPEFRVG